MSIAHDQFMSALESMGNTMGIGTVVKSEPQISEHIVIAEIHVAVNESNLPAPIDTTEESPK